MDLALDKANGIYNEISNKVFELQNRFLNSFIGKTVNNLADTALRIALPDAVEEQIIDIKDAFLENGVKEGTVKIVDTIKDFGKSALGLVTGNFENISQLTMAVKNGGIIPMISKMLDNAISKIEKKGIINNFTAVLIKEVKDGLLKSVKKSLTSSLKEQEKYVQKLELYTSNWKEAYQKQDFKSMEKAYKKLEEYLEKVMPTEKIYKEGRVIENIHNLIKNNGENFELSEDELKLTEILY